MNFFKDNENAREIHIYPQPLDLFQAAAEDFKRRAIHAIEQKGIFTVVLSGGETPKKFLDMLVGADIPWGQIQFFFSDERYVPADDEASNYHMAYEHLFSKVPVPPENIYRMPTYFENPQEAAQEYDRILRNIFRLKEDEFPRFDLIYLGLGEDAHTASLMPFHDLKKGLLVTSLWVSELNMYRMTLTPEAINQSESIIFFVTGSNKAKALWNVLEGPANPQRYPAQLIHCVHSATVWYLDQAAAGKLMTDDLGE
jgi:6-phosphogluconolactonase